MKEVVGGMTEISKVMFEGTYISLNNIINISRDTVNSILKAINC